MDNAQLINQDTGEKEWYTPAEIIEAARVVMGAIELDVSSCDEANQTVKASRFFSKEIDGLSQPWNGRVWMNHPFSKELNSKWIAKLVSEYESGNVTEACCITFASTSERWFRPLLNYPQCFLTTRTKYTAPMNRRKPAPPKGSVVTYMGQNIGRFDEVFSRHGVIKTKYQ